MRSVRSAGVVAAILTAALAACGPAQDGAGDAATADLAGKLASLQLRATRARDIDDIKRLQHAYGFYLDEGLWDEAANLFAQDGTIEIGLDGVYVGRERVRAYLYAMGGGRSELPAGRLNEHMQVMPVITLAPDGRSAKGRWREILMVGTLGENANWGEGPMENEYVKENGVWKIKSAHWYESMLVPYAGGWRVNEDETRGIHVSQALPPDRPPSVVYETWPGVYVPPYHFANPGVTPAAPPTAAPPADATPQELAAEVAALDREVALLEAENEVERLQRIFGYYFDEALWSEAAALFAPDATVELGARGVYVGPERILALFRTLGAEGPRDGRLFDHMQLQPVIHVASDGRSARARWRLFSQVAEHGEFARWGVGVYVAEYARLEEGWRIRSLRLFPTMTTPYESGWAELTVPEPGPSTELPPDRPSTSDFAPYPASFIAPFHFDNPVMAPRRPPAQAAPIAADRIEDALTSIERRITRLEDADALERLNSVYGYYLANNEWENFANLFAEDGTIEIAMRGVYVGRENVLRSMTLYGEPGARDGLLHNHMQFQPVWTIAEDGGAARMRSRALSIMGTYERYATWMGGVYENSFTKGDDGVWRFQTDRQFNTYFANYDAGWKDMRQGSPPGVSEDNPPDRPPTSPFEMYPTAFVVPFHYDNPGTGRPTVVPETE